MGPEDRGAMNLRLKEILSAILLSLFTLFGSEAVFARTLECQAEMDQELQRSGLPSFNQAMASFDQTKKRIERSAFKKNDVGQYPAYLLVDDWFSRPLIGALTQMDSGGEAPADQVVAFRDRQSPKMVVFLKGARVVGYSVSLSGAGTSDGIGKSVLLDRECVPQDVKLSFSLRAGYSFDPVIDLNPSDCSRLAELEAIAKTVEVGENEPIFDALCRIRGGSLKSTRFDSGSGIDDDRDCKCDSETIYPELEHWEGRKYTCLSPARPAQADVFASLISVKSSFINYGFQTLVSQLKSPHSVFAQQCAVSFPSHTR